MPMQLTVNRNRKTSQNYNSEGFGVSITVELDQSLLNQPDELQRKISQLYREAELSLDRQANGENDRPVRHVDRDLNGNGRHGGSMTTSQERAIHAIARRLQIDDVDAECHQALGVGDLKRLTIREASTFIDHLKSLEPARRNGGGR